MLATVGFREIVVAMGLLTLGIVSAPSWADDDDPRLAIVSEATVSVVTRGPFGDCALERAELTSGRPQPSSPVGEVPEIRRGFSHPPRWRLGHGYYWGVNLKGSFGGGFRGGLRRLQPPSADIVRIPVADLRPTPHDAHAAPPADQPPMEVGSAEPLTSALNLAWVARMGPIYFDIVPLGSHACRVFILYDGELESWDYRFHWEPRAGIEGHWKEVRRIPVAWNEPFLALPDGPDRLFLATSTGALWEILPGVDTVRSVWSDPARPIRWVVIDSTHARTFALGTGFMIPIEHRSSPVTVEKTPTDLVDSLASALNAARSVLPTP